MKAKGLFAPPSGGCGKPAEETTVQVKQGARESRVGGRREKRKEARQTRRERNGPAYFMQNRPHVWLEARVQHVLSSPIAPVGVVPWKALVCVFSELHASRDSTVSKSPRSGASGKSELYETLREPLPPIMDGVCCYLTCVTGNEGSSSGGEKNCF